MSDDAFCDAVAAIVRDEIFNGEGCNFLISRKTFVYFEAVSPELFLNIFKYLIQNDLEGV